MSNIIKLENLHKKFHDMSESHGRSVLGGISLNVERGEFLVIVGPSGAGKSTLLRAISGLDQDFFGTVTLAPDVVPGDISFVFQQFALLPWLSVAENVELPLLARPLDELERRHEVHQSLKLFGLTEAAQRRPHELSGGMRQRAGLARAMVTNPKIILMDEPFSELDTVIAHQLRQELLAVWAARQPTIVLVTHNISEALELADRIVILSDRPATVRHILKNTLPRPRPRRSVEFFALEDRITAII